MQLTRGQMLAAQWLNEMAAETRRTILMRHARLAHGKPVFCHHGKAVFDTIGAAEAAGHDLAELGGAKPLRPYRCQIRGIGEHLHYHLTSKRVR
jgi:hypothetical protein